MSSLRGGWRGSPTRGNARGRGNGPVSRTGGGTDTRPRKVERQVQDPTAWRGKKNKTVPTGKKRGKSASPSSSDEPPSQSVAQAAPQETSVPTQGNIEKSWQELKTRRIKEKEDAIARGLMDDPQKAKRLEDAITFRGTCQTMCPEFERVSRIYQNGVDKCEKDAFGNPVAERFVKRFERSSAGREPPLPSDVRPPLILQKTLDYLIDQILGGLEPLRNTNKFLFDRTRAIRMDFTLQNIGQSSEIPVAIDCFERICRLHILSLHQMLSPKNASVQFSEPQEREQLLATLISIMQSYADAKLQGFPCKNEAEFRSIYVIAYMGVQDVEWEAQRWDPEIFHDPRVQAALELYAAWQNCNDAKSPLDKISSTVTPEVVQNSFARFWSIMRSSRVSYPMACMAEVHFNQLRRMALSAIIAGCKTRASVTDWTLSDLMVVLGLDDEDQVQYFCELFGLGIKEREDGEAYLILKDAVIKEPIPPPGPIFSQSIVEAKRHNRTFPAVVRGYTVKQARDLGLIKRPMLDPAAPEFTPNLLNSDSLFISDDEGESGQKSAVSANAFTTTSVGTFQANRQNGIFSNGSVATSPPGGIFGTSTTPTPSTSGGSNAAFASVPSAQRGIFSRSNSASTSTFGKPFAFSNQASTSNNTPPFPFSRALAEASASNSIALTQSNNTSPFSFGQPSGIFNQPSTLNNASSSKPPSIFSQGTTSNGGSQTSVDKPSGSPGLGVSTSIFRTQFPTSVDPASRNPSGVSSGSAAAFASRFGTTPSTTAASPATLSPAPKAPFSFVSSITSQSSTGAGTPNTNEGFSAPPLTSSGAGSTPATFEVAPVLPSTSSVQPGSHYGGFVIDNTSPPIAPAVPATSNGGFLSGPMGKTPVAAPTLTNGTKVPTAQMALPSPSPVFSSQFNFPGEVKSTLSQPQPQPGKSQQGARLDATASPVSSIFAKTKIDMPDTQQQRLSAFQPTPAQSVLSQPRPGTVAQQKPLPSFDTTSPVFNFGPTSSSTSQPRKPSSVTSTPENVPKQRPVEAGSNITSNSSPKSNHFSQEPRASPSVPTSQKGPEQRPPTKQISEEFADWFLWGKDGIYDQLYEHIFPAIAANAKRKLRDENDRQLADKFRERKLMQRYFYRWRESAYRRRIRRRGRQHRAMGPTHSKSQDLQWTPVQFRPGSDVTGEAALRQTIEAKKTIYKPVPLTNIFTEAVQQAFATAGISNGRWSLFAVSSDPKTDYWWQNKFGLYSGDETSKGRMIKDTLDGSTFAAFPRATTPDLFTDIGCVIFGCSVDYSLSNTERFRKDRENLHNTMQYICSNSRYQNIALLVVCYRSPLDETDLTFKDVDMGRCGPKGRQDRVSAAREALDFQNLPENIIGRDLIIVDSKGDLDLMPSVAPLAELVLATINPDLAKEKAQRPEKRQGVRGGAPVLTTVLLGPSRNGVGKHTEALSRSPSAAKSDTSKKRPGPDRDTESGSPNPNSPSPKRSRSGEHQMSPPSGHRRSLPSSFQGGKVPADEVLMKWKRLREEAESPYARSVNTPVSRHQRSQTMGNGSLLGNSLHLRSQQQMSPNSSSSRTSSLLSGSSSQFHRGARDKTNTDYFRLKARGIEKLPNGSVVPAVFKDLSKKRTSETVSGRMDTLQRPAQKKVLVQGNVARDDSKLNPGTNGCKRKKTDVEEDEELFAEARKVMGAMTEGMEFYREETKRILSRSGSQSVSGSDEPDVRW